MSERDGMTRLSVVILAASSAFVLSLLAGCSHPVDQPNNPQPTGSLAPAQLPKFDEARGAEGNMVLFGGTIREQIDKVGWLVPTERVARALIAAGFSRKGIEFSPNYTSLGMKPDSITVAVKLDKQCIIGQYGPAFKDVAVSVAPFLATGGCLLGRSIEHL
jgi:hypothetical protein